MLPPPIFVKGKDMLQDIGEQEIVNQFCEACDGFYGAPCKYCNGFKIAYLMCELGLDEDWDWLVPAKGSDEIALLEALRLVKRTLVGNAADFERKKQ